MSETTTVVTMGLGIYALRLLGLVAPMTVLPPILERALRSLPIALLTALVASSPAGASSGDPVRLAALGAAGAIVWTSRRLWAGIGGGLAVFWLLDAIV
jgi:branched-subunit amino acid transport protein